MACGGRCCESFPLNMSPARLGEKYLAVIDYRDAGGEMDRYLTDVVTIAEMLIPLHEESDEQPRYTCKHLDSTSGLCTIYERRPQMCSDYPSYGRGGNCLTCGYTPPPPQ